MNVSLTPELEEMIRQQVAGGGYASASEVVREALRAMQIRQQKLERLRSEIQIGINQIERGEFVEYTPDFWERMMREARERANAGKPIKNAVQP